MESQFSGQHNRNNLVIQTTGGYLKCPRQPVAITKEASFLSPTQPPNSKGRESCLFKITYAPEKHKEASHSGKDLDAGTQTAGLGLQLTCEADVPEREREHGFKPFSSGFLSSPSTVPGTPGA